MVVNNVNALPTYAAGRADAAGNIADGDLQGSFEQVMAKLNSKADSLQTDLSAGSSLAGQNVVPASTVRQDMPVGKTDVQAAGKSNQAGNTVRKESDGNVTQDAKAGAKADAGTDHADSVSEELEKSGEELIQDIADKLDVTREEVEAAMAVLGLTAVQLFDTDNLKQLLLTISGGTDELSLLTDAALYGNLKDLFQVVEESLESLKKELGLSEEELDALMKQMVSGQGQPDGTAEEPGQEAGLEGMKDYTVSVQKDGETVQMKVTVEDESGDKSIRESVTGTSKTEVPGIQKMQEKDVSADSGREGHAGHALLQAPETPVGANEVPETANIEYRSMQTEEIMNQIVEYMKINLKADTQSMELQLHPASLGTLNIQIMARDGGLTAHFTAQNETVRAVIETQLIQLKNQFEEQGLKVDAVEVTVANHAYGQQFSQDNENAEQSRPGTGKGRRRINLDQIEGEEELEELEDSERIAVEMMRVSGGTVDYTA